MLNKKYLNAVLMLLIVVLSVIPLISVPHTYSQLPLPSGVSRKDVVILDIIQGRTPTPDNYNVWVIGVPQGHIHQFCVDTLWYSNLSDPRGTLVNVLAADAPRYENNYRTLIIKLKQGVYWSDGVEFTADDVVFTLNALAANPNLNWYDTVRTWVSGAKALDKYTVEIDLTQPNPYAHYLFVVQAWNAIYIMPKHYFEKVGVQNIHTDKFYPPICIGPYVLYSYDSGGMWFLWKRRDDYLRSDLGDLIQKYGWYGGPQWVLERAFLSESAKVLAVQSGELDTMFDPSPEAFSTILSAMSGRIQPWFSEWPYFWGYDPTNRGIYFNIMKYPYNISLVRWALALAVNMTKVMTDAYGGIQRIVVLPVGTLGPTLYWQQKLLPWLENLEITLPDGSKFKVFDDTIPLKIYNWAKAQGYIKEEWSKDRIAVTWGIGWWKYAPDVATKILTELGFKKGSDGSWYLPNGSKWKMTLYIPTYELDAIRLGQAVAAMWKDFGIDVSVVQLDSTPFWNAFNYGTFEVGAYWGLHAFASDPFVIPFNYQGLECQFARPIGNYSVNAIRYCNPKLDELINKALQLLPGSPEQVNATGEIIKLVVSDMVSMTAGDCKKLLFYVKDYWEGWPSAENPGVNPMFWCEPFKIQLVQLYPKGWKPTTTSPSPTPTTSSPTPTTTTTSPTTTTTPTTTATTTPPPATTSTAAMTAVTTTVVVPTTIVSTVVSTVSSVSTATLTATTTVTQRVTEWTTTIAIAIVLLIIGFAIGWLIKRK